MTTDAPVAVRSASALASAPACATAASVVSSGTTAWPGTLASDCVASDMTPSRIQPSSAARLCTRVGATRMRPGTVSAVVARADGATGGAGFVRVASITPVVAIATTTMAAIPIVKGFRERRAGNEGSSATGGIASTAGAGAGISSRRSETAASPVGATH